jgi:DNA-binding response OmpR family regulator
MKQNINILIIEPSQTEKYLYSEIFSEGDFDVSNCNSVSEATQLMNRTKFDVLITDLYLPDYTGIEVVKLLRSNTKCPIIVVSSIPYVIGELKKFDNIQAFYKPYNMMQLMHAVVTHTRV